LLGPNGAGKTTLLSAVAGLVRPDAGTIAVLGFDAVAHPAEARRRLGLAPQRLGLTPTLSVRENMQFAGRLAGGTGSGATLGRRVSEVADALGLGDLLDRKAGRLSGGEQRRVHVACALVHEPPVLLLDEPTSGVDPAGRRALLELVRGQSSRGVAVCYSTHLLPDAEDLDGPVAILHRGRVVARDTVTALVARHGRSVVDLRFASEVTARLGPSAAWASAEVMGRTIRLTTDEPGPAIAQALAALDADLPGLQSVDVTRTGLETVFLALTGEHFAPSDRVGEAG
jgi:ABC-2 type transport system ATP-binding protein